MAAAAAAAAAGRLLAPAAELRCEATLACGQIFGWRALAPTRWAGVLRDRVVTIEETPHEARYALHPAPPVGGEEEAALHAAVTDFFRLDHSLAALTSQWATADARFRAVAPHIQGLRLLRQNPVECLFSFICSSCNNIPRITQMLDALRRRYGAPLGEVEGRAFYAFPSLERLAEVEESALRELGFGYRAKFVTQSARALRAREGGGEDFLLSLRSRPRADAVAALTELPGVGPKVADCVALFALDKLDCVPVDTHVWQIATRDYSAELADVATAKTLTPRVYARVGDFFRARFGPLAGWAHSVLFAGDLGAFQARLPAELRRTPATPPKRSASAATTSPAAAEKPPPAKRSRPARETAAEESDSSATIDDSDDERPRSHKQLRRRAHSSAFK